MIFTLGFALIGSAFALSHAQVAFATQQSILQDSCPLTTLLLSDEHRQDVYGSFHDAAARFNPNISRLSHSLEDSRKLALRSPSLPWTFWPECFSSEDTAEPYCVFTDQTFAAGRGIVIIGEKNAAYALRNTPAFRQPEIHAPLNHYANPPFVQHDFPSKGRGLVANTTLHRGSQIFASTPLLLLNADATSLPTPDRLALLHRGLATLPPNSRTRFWNLTSHTASDPIDDRITTNCFNVRIAGTSHAALFPEIALLNHDCRPNAAYFWDEATLSQRVHAIRTIAPGEEITITYVDNERERATRMRRLERNWGFKCGCAACTADPVLTRESDARLRQIEGLVTMLGDWTEAGLATPGAVQLLISLIEQERLEASLATAYKVAAEVYSSFGERYEAIRYARLGVEFSMLDKGFSDDAVQEMEEMSVAPELSWSWKKRVGLEAGSSC